MITKIIPCLLALAFCTACTSTQTASRQTLAERVAAQHSTNPYLAGEPAPPAEGPEDIPPEGSLDVQRNPALVPTPLLRASAASGL